MTWLERVRSWARDDNGSDGATTGLLRRSSEKLAAAMDELGFKAFVVGSADARKGH